MPSHYDTSFTLRKPSPPIAVDGLIAAEFCDGPAVRLAPRFADPEASSLSNLLAYVTALLALAAIAYVAWQFFTFF